MSGLRQSAPWRSAVGGSYVLLLLTLVLCLVRAEDQPGVEIGLGSTDATIVPADVAVALLAAALVVRLTRRRRLPAGAAALAAAGTFALYVAASSVPNGGAAVVSAVKLSELGVIAFGVALLADTRRRLTGVVLVACAMTAAAVVWALVGFAERPGSRQASFVGEHDLAALGTMALAVALATAFAARQTLGRRLPVALGLAGALGIVLGASLASLLGVYAASASLIGLAAVRGSARLRAVLLTLLAAAAVTGGTLALRQGELGFLNELVAEEQEPGQFAASWSQRLIFSYIGGRIFLDSPVVGTGWWGLLPAEEYAPYLQDAHERFSNQPARYFPSADGTLVPQQTYDQILYELGLVGGVLFVALAAVAARDAWRTGRSWPRDEPDELLAYVPAAWLASTAGALAGAALFGGTPMAAIFWITLGVVVAGRALTPAAVDVPHGHASPLAEAS